MKDEPRFWRALTDLAERRIRLILAAHEATPIYNPHAERELGWGRTCERCRKVQRYDRKVCDSCGFLTP